MTPEIRTIELPGGLKLPCVEQGDRSGTPVVLLHGITDSWRSFEPLLPHLPRSLRVIALTQRGHGDADRPLKGYRSQDFAADVAAFMDALQIGRAVIVGHSMGSSVAQRFALDYPERTLGLVLLASFRTMQCDAGIMEFYETTITGLADPVPEDLAREFQLSTLARPVSDDYFELVVAESLKVPALVWREAFAGLVNPEHAARLGEISAPTLIIWGDRDAIFPLEEQQALRAAIPGARLKVHSGLGHALHWEEPELIAADIVAFTEPLDERRPGTSWPVPPDKAALTDRQLIA